MEQNQFNPGQFQQQPQPQYQPQGFQPQGFPPQGFQTIPLPRYNVSGIWQSLAALDFKTMSLAGVGAWIFCFVISLMTSGTVNNIFNLLQSISAAFIICLVFSKVAPYLKNNNVVGLLVLIGSALFVIGSIVGIIAIKNLSYTNLGSTIKLMGLFGVAGYGAVAAGMLMTGFSLKHFSLRPVVLLYGIGYAFVTLGSLFLFGSSLSAFGTYGLFAGIGGFVVLAALIVLLIKALGSSPIMDPYALPGEPIQQ